MNASLATLPDQSLLPLLYLREVVLGAVFLLFLQLLHRGLVYLLVGSQPGPDKGVFG